MSPVLIVVTPSPLLPVCCCRCDSLKSSNSGSCRSPGDAYVRGRELITISTSVREVSSSSYASLAWPMIFFRHRFVERTIHSNMPPHQGAFSALNFHSTPSPVRCCWPESPSHSLERLAIIGHNSAGQTMSGHKPLQTSEKGGGSQVRHEVEMHSPDGAACV